MEYSNPRTTFETDDWPYGRHNRVRAVFTVESGTRGERVSRVTSNPKGGTNKPKKTTYARLVRIVDGSDGKTYIAELSQFGHITIMQSNLKFQQESIFTDSDRYQSIADLLEGAI